MSRLLITWLVRITFKAAKYIFKTPSNTWTSATKNVEQHLSLKQKQTSALLKISNKKKEKSSSPKLLSSYHQYMCIFIRVLPLKLLKVINEPVSLLGRRKTSILPSSFCEILILFTLIQSKIIKLKMNYLNKNNKGN